MPEEELRALFRRAKTLGRRLRDDGPQTPDELHAWVLKNIGVDIPRVAVCEDHDPPFKLLSDCYFHNLKVELADGTVVDVNAALVLANRGGSKTFIVAVLHFLNATFKGAEGLQFGATEGQGKRCYEKIEDWCYKHDELGRRLDTPHDFILGKPMRSETRWKTGGKVEVVAGSENAVSGPHPQVAGADEVDQMEEPVWVQSRGMAVAGKAKIPLPSFMAKFDGVIPPMDVVSSTMNSTQGKMKQLVDEHEADVKASTIPEHSLIKWCIFETIQEVPNCRCAPQEERQARLKELGREPEELCLCNKVVKGVFKDPVTGDVSPRTLEKVCGGKAFRARGFKPYVDFLQTFKRNTPGTWKLQHECRPGQDENAYIQDWSLDTYGVRNYEPRPEYGPIYCGYDWGGTNPAVCLWIQYLKFDVPAFDHNYNPIFLSSNTYVLFREAYIAGIDSAKFQVRCAQIEKEYRARYGAAWRVKGRFMDPQGKDPRILFRRKGMGGSWPFVTRNKGSMITIVQNLVIDDRFAVDSEQAPMFCEEIEGWGKKPGTDNELDKFNHAMSAWRYGIANAEVKEGNRVPGADGEYIGPEVNSSVNPEDIPEEGRRGATVTVKRTKRRRDGRIVNGPVAFSSGDPHPTETFDAALR